MSRTKPTAPASLKATRIQLRIEPAQKAVLARAAQLRRTTLSSFVLEHACEAAQQVLAEQVDVVMPAEEWAAFCNALDSPPRSIAALKKLLTEASVFDGTGTAGEKGRGMACKPLMLGRNVPRGFADADGVDHRRYASIEPM